MKRIESFGDFRQYGIGILTGERCAYGIRILFDVNEQGKRILEDFLQVTLPYPNWNPDVNGKDAVASIMLPRGIFRDLAMFCLFHVDRCFAIHDGNGLLGLTEAEYAEMNSEPAFSKRIIMNWNYGPKNEDVTVGSLNRHQMSGRVR